MSADGSEPTLIGSVQRALRLVDIVANSPRPIPVKLLAQATGLTPGTTYNLVRTLIHEGYLATEPDGLVLGARFPAFQDAAPARGVFLAQVRAALRQVAEDVGATAYLSRFDDGEVHLVDIVDVDHDPRVELWVGMQDGAHATALGKQILSVLPQDERMDYLARHPLAELTPRTISDRERLLEQLERSRRWTVERGEYALGFTCLAVPVLAPGIIASLAISVRADGEHPVGEDVIARLQDAARQLSVALGTAGLSGRGQFTI
ncbi:MULTISPECIES: IclR family transcriptional regulator [Microbacterium]|uniref:IclR family transcriptional regulator n=1 Tax=Microbacterium TaxID=33882 RepID=UPI0022F04AC2|nr:IclR family transcriptional regulator [Streptomyces sp. MS2A]